MISKKQPKLKVTQNFKKTIRNFYKSMRNLPQIQQIHLKFIEPNENEQFNNKIQEIPMNLQKTTENNLFSNKNSRNS